MLCFSISIFLAVFSLAPTLVVPTTSIDDVELPSDPNKKVKVYHTFKKFLYKVDNSSWYWELDGDSHLKIQAGYDTRGSFGAYVVNGMKNRTLTVQIHSGKMHCRSSQTYSANIVNQSNKTVENFDFKLHTRGGFSDRWHLIEGQSLKETYVWFRKTLSLSGPVKRKDNEKKVAHIHCDTDQIDCKISTNDELPIDYLIALITCADIRCTSHHTRSMPNHSTSSLPLPQSTCNCYSSLESFEDKNPNIFFNFSPDYFSSLSRCLTLTIYLPCHTASITITPGHFSGDWLASNILFR
ncbi:hypothetical protein O181_034499 [Austropuccinia psidii MF-1]|uniref:Uncharacterized protein n=1 Tax=Austropuccinia psidii MF-1 TaxID=1389203 RepID=A0A9Q3H9L4_9BASI|nr:hypothetical protein [Austropuccinia psidii MF-1]